MKAKQILEVLKGTAKEFNEDRVMRLSAALAYYAIFSIGPMLFLLITLAGFAFGADAVRGEVEQQIKGFVGEQSAKTIQSMIAAPKIGHNMLTTVLGIVTLLLGATGLFGQLQDALNTIWEVKAKPGLGIWSFLRNRFLSLGMVFGLGFLLLVSMVLTTAVEALANGAGRALPIPDFVAAGASTAVAFLFVTLFFALLFKFLPDVKVPWRAVWTGALATGLLFTIGKYLLSLYLGRQATASGYGAAGSVVVILLWIYYASLILFFGAEFTQVYATQKKLRVRPSRYAVPITEEARAQEGMPRLETFEKDPYSQEEVVHAKQSEPSHATTASQASGEFKHAFKSSHETMASPTRASSPILSFPQRHRGVGFAVAASLATLAFWKFKSLRRALRAYKGVKQTVKALS